jgi:glycosyltransferase involved in cell wall biosynthesis
VLIGAGPRLDELTRQARRLGISGAVRFTGAVPHDEVPELLAGVDVTVAPYLPLEDFYFQPLKVIEYLAAGKPVLYADQGDLAALIGGAGLGYASGSVSGLAGALDKVLGDAELRAEMAAVADLRGAAFDWSVIAQRLARFAAGDALAELEPAHEAVGFRC